MFCYKKNKVHNYNSEFLKKHVLSILGMQKLYLLDNTDLFQ